MWLLPPPPHIPPKAAVFMLVKEAQPGAGRQAVTVTSQSLKTTLTQGATAVAAGLHHSLGFIYLFYCFCASCVNTRQQS